MKIKKHCEWPFYVLKWWVFVNKSFDELEGNITQKEFWKKQKLGLTSSWWPPKLPDVGLSIVHVNFMLCIQWVYMYAHIHVHVAEKKYLGTSDKV